MKKILKKLKSNKKITITAIGDSLTEGWMVDKGYVDFLEELINDKYTNAKLKIDNRGVSGNCAREGFYRMKHFPIKETPDLVIIQFGLNDAFTGISPRDFGNDIKEIINKIRENHNPEILLISSTPYYNPAGIDIMDYFYKELEFLSQEESTTYLKIHESWKNSLKSMFKEHELLQLDGVHPTETGYKLMAKTIMELL